MSNGSRLSRGDRRRNDRLARLRAVVTRETAVLAFDLAADKQVCALTDQDSRVLARRTVKVKAWQLREAVKWGLAQAAAAGFSSVVVACEPTGHRWRVLDQIAAPAHGWSASSRCWCTGPGRARTSPATRATRPTR
jgi:transposase